MMKDAGRPGTARPLTPIDVELPITLGQFVKLAGMTGTGGHAKASVLAGLVLLNGCVETRRGRKLAPGDIVEMEGNVAVVVEARPHPQAAEADSVISGSSGPGGPPPPDRLR